MYSSIKSVKKEKRKKRDHSQTLELEEHISSIPQSLSALWIEREREREREAEAKANSSRRGREPWQ